MGKVLHFAKDTLRNLLQTTMGTVGGDKAASGYYDLPLWTDDQLISAYRSSWVARKLVDIPAFDSFRRWRDWQADAAVITAIEDEEKRLGLKEKLLETKIKARLFGGAALYISTGESNLLKPLDPTRVTQRGIRFCNIMLRRHLNAGPIEMDPESEWFGKPQYYEIMTNNPIQGTTSVRIHPSRFVIFKGVELPDDELSVSVAGRGWGDSVLVATMRAIQDADATAANIASLVFEAKVDVVRVPDLMASLMDPEYKERLIERFTLAKQSKGVNAMLLLDKEEEYEQKSATFQTLPDILMAFFQLVSGAADIPVTRFLGQSPAGLNATGESDLRNYYDRVQAIQTVEITPSLRILDEALIRSATGGRDPNIFYTWASLWQMSDKERADIGKTIADTVVALNNTGLFPPEGLANAAINTLVENSVMPGLDESIEEAGGLPDYEAELEAERETQVATAAAVAAAKGGQQVRDARPMTLYVRRDVLNKDEIRRWAKSQGIEEVMNDLHVTIIHTRTKMDWIKLGDDYGASGEKLTIGEGGPRLMERFGEALVLQFASQRLAWRNMDIRNQGAEVDFEEYQPHITLTWNPPQGVALAEIKPYLGQIELGPEIFEEVDDNWKSNIQET